MYYVNTKQIEERLDFLPTLIQASQVLLNEENTLTSTVRFAKERVLHLAIELVTDVGSLMIDGFLMREASSYEDIMEVLRDEKVFEVEASQFLMELVKWRKPLIQQYFTLTAGEYNGLFQQLPDGLTVFGESIRDYLRKEL